MIFYSFLQAYLSHFYRKITQRFFESPKCFEDFIFYLRVFEEDGFDENSVETPNYQIGDDCYYLLEGNHTIDAGNDLCKNLTMTLPFSQKSVESLIKSLLNL